MLAGRIAACRLVHLTCQRFLRDLGAAEAGKGSWEFRPELAERAMTFAGLLPNIRGPKPDAAAPDGLAAAGVRQPVRLCRARHGGARRFRQGIVFVPRGNGKTSIAAPLALYLSFMDGEGGAEGYAAAVTRDQARILFDTARADGAALARRSAAAMVWQALANAIWQERTASNFRPHQLGCQSAGRAQCAGGGVRRDRQSQRPARSTTCC